MGPENKASSVSSKLVTDRHQGSGQRGQEIEVDSKV